MSLFERFLSIPGERADARRLRFRSKPRPAVPGFAFPRAGLGSTLGEIGAVAPEVSIPGIPRAVALPTASESLLARPQRIEIPTGAAGTAATFQAMAEQAVEASKDPTLVMEARSIVRACGSKDYRCEADAILRWVKEVVTYRHDGAFQEMQQAPGWTLYVDGAGDCFVKGTKVLLREGHRLVPIESLRVGDEIWGFDRWSKVLATYEKGNLPTWLVRTNNGGNVRFTQGHHVWVLRCSRHARRKVPCACPKEGRERVRVEVSELRSQDVLLTPDRIPFGSKSMDLGKAYVEGLYLSDGWTHSGERLFCISGRDGHPREEQKREVERICEALGIETRWGRTHIAVKDAEWTRKLKTFGTLPWTKGLPTIAFDEPTAREILRGLMADSGLSTALTGRLYSSASEELCLQARVLLKMFGVSCHATYLSPEQHGSTSLHGIHRLSIRSTLDFLGTIYEKIHRKERKSKKSSRPDKLLRVREVIRDDAEAPCFDLTTDDHMVWLPEADVTVSQCNNVSTLIAALDLAVGAHGVKFRAVALNPDNPTEYSHVYPMVAVSDGKGGPHEWFAQDFVPTPARLGFEPPSRLWVLPPLDFVILSP